MIRRTDYRNENNFLSLSSYEDIGNGKCEAFFLIGMYTKRFSYCYLVTLYTYLVLFSDLDVMGQMVDLGEVRMCQLTTGENRKRVQFRLRDTRYILFFPFALF